MARSGGKRIALVMGIAALVVLGVAVFLGWRDLIFWYRFEALGKNAEGFPEYRHRRTGIVMVLLPGGRFFMGAQKDDPGGPNYDPGAWEEEGPVREVTLSPFLMSKYEVTQAQWKSVLGSNPSRYQGDDDRPVESIRPKDIRRFLAKTGFLLPTEAQWEYACRGGSSTPFSGTGDLDDMGWHMKNGGFITHPVGKKEPNGFGLHDTHGNVWEWCEDVYDGGFYKNPLARKDDPVSSAGSGDRCIRGGGWNYDAMFCRSACRGRTNPDIVSQVLGCRPVMPRP
jgi:formylglycine-generating enzyme required for sulfatase activity